jgi:hypothetical protein
MGLGAWLSLVRVYSGGTIRLHLRRFLFIPDPAHLVDAIDDAEMGAAVPGDMDGTAVVDKIDAALVTGLQPGIWIVH